MSNRALDKALYAEHLAGEIACAECGFHRNGAHHPKIRCPTSGRCGDCGNDWPCPDHAPKDTLTAQERKIVDLVPDHGLQGHALGPRQQQTADRLVQRGILRKDGITYFPPRKTRNSHG